MSRYCKHGIDPRNCYECPSERAAPVPSDTPESDEIWNGEWNHAYLFKRIRKMERERNALRAKVGGPALVQISTMSEEETQQAIDATHPETLDTPLSLAADQLAMELIHNRHGKREIVNLIRWLILGAPNAAAD